MCRSLKTLDQESRLSSGHIAQSTNQFTLGEPNEHSQESRPRPRNPDPHRQRDAERHSTDRVELHRLRAVQPGARAGNGADRSGRTTHHSSRCDPHRHPFCDPGCKSGPEWPDRIEDRGQPSWSALAHLPLLTMHSRSASFDQSV